MRNGSQLANLCLIAPAGIRVKRIPSGDNFIWSREETARNLFHDQSFAELMLSTTPSKGEKDRELTNRFMAARLGAKAVQFRTMKIRKSLGSRPRNQTTDELIGSATVVVGSPQTVREKIGKMRDATGLSNMVSMLQFGVLPDDLTRQNMELFASEVTPRFRD